MKFNSFSPFMLVLSGNIDVPTSGGTTWGVEDGTIFWNNDPSNPQFVIFVDEMYQGYDYFTGDFGEVLSGLPADYVIYNGELD